MDRRYGVAPSPRDPRDRIRPPSGAVLPATATLAVDGWLPGVLNQGVDEDCVAFAMGYGRSMMRYRHMKQVVDFSTHWFWCQLRAREGTARQNVGTYPVDAMKVARKQGFCEDALMPQWQGNYEELPPPGCDTNAFPYRITRYQRCMNIPSMKEAIVEGNQLLFAILVNRHFEAGGTNGLIDWDGDTNYLGGHAVWPYEYVDDTAVPGGGYFVVRNQWGQGWAKGGDCWLTYAFMQSPAWMETWEYS